MSFPFSRTYADTFAKRVRAAASRLQMEKKGNGTNVTLQALRDVFTTAAWADLQKEESRITKLISSDVFKSSKGGIDVNALILFGVLNCPGDIKHKSIALYWCLQDGGPSKQ